MKLWLLRPIENLENDPWEDRYDLPFGAVVRAETEQRAREIANNETSGAKYLGDAWLKPEYSTCIELVSDGNEGVIIEDYHAG